MIFISRHTLHPHTTFFFFTHPATTEIYTLSLHDALPISVHHTSASSTVRYVWQQASPYEIALSLKRKAYLSHATALFLHGLNEQIPSRIFVNAEQSPKPTSGNLTQEGIHRAFANKQRESNFVFQFNDSEAVLIWGKNTGQLEVAQLDYSGTK